LGSPLGALVNADGEKWWPIIKDSGIKAESRSTSDTWSAASSERRRAAAKPMSGIAQSRRPIRVSGMCSSLWAYAMAASFRAIVDGLRPASASWADSPPRLSASLR
jgi:hypothetical protein